MAELEAIIKEQRRVLEPGGTFIIREAELPRDIPLERYSGLLGIAYLLERQGFTERTLVTEADQETYQALWQQYGRAFGALPEMQGAYIICRQGEVLPEAS